MQTLAATFALMLLPIIGSGGELTTLSSCICPGYEAVFECVVTGGGVTIWSGTAFNNCPNDRITLRHSYFNQPGYSISGPCGDGGQVIGRAISAVNDSYTSRFILNVSQNLIGANIDCERQSDGMLHVGREQILLTTAPLPPPSNVTLFKINSSRLTFTWNSVSPDCQAVHYKINATNCGQCPNTANSNSVTCTIPTKIAFEQNCVFTVQTVVCGNVSGIPSEPIVFAMKVPNAPRINATSEYSDETKKLIKISVELVTSGLLGNYNIITDDISYTINYIDITSGSTCGSVTLPASSCDDGVCTTAFEVSSSLCSPQADISISAFATNIFGDGQLSDSIHIGAINHFVDIDFDFIATNAIKCTFLNQRLGTPKSCSIEYGPKEETHCSNSQQSIISSKGTPITVSSDTVSISLHPSTIYGTEYCYRLTASDGITTVIINGTFAACDPDQLSDGKSVREDIACGASHTALGMENGFVCYGGTKVGSIAMHYCYDCGLSAVQGPLIRMCGRNGLWNGSVPRCECNHFSTDLAPVLIGTIGGIVLIFTGTVIIFAIIIIILCKTKARLSKQLLDQQHAHGKDIIDVENKIYEEIDPMPQPKMDTENNVAYASCHSVMRSASCVYQLQFSNNK